MKKVALLIYPEFSLQEVSCLMYIFRWYYDCKTVTFSSSKELVYSEEGIAIAPEKTFDEFVKEEYYCLIVSGCCDFTAVLKDMALFRFLHQFKAEKDLVIGAICGGPMLLSLAGLLNDKKFTNSVFDEMNKQFSFIHEEHLVYAPIVTDRNIVTAIGDAYREFAIAVARACGFSCSDEALQGIQDGWKEEELIHHIPKTEMKEFLEQDLAEFETAYEAIKKSLL